MTIKSLLLGTAVLSTIGISGMLTIQSVSADSGQGQTYVKTTEIDMPIRGTNGGIWSHPYGQKNAAYLGEVKSIAGQKVTAYGAYKDTDSGVLWVEINYNNVRGWVDANTLTEMSAIGNWGVRYVNVSNFETKMKRPAIVHATVLDNRFDNDYGRNKNVIIGKESGIVGSLNPYNGKGVEVNATFVDKNGVTWANISPLDNVNNFSWINASRLEMKDTPRIELGQLASENYKVTLNGHGDVWTRPYGLENSQWLRSVQSLGNDKQYAVDKVVSIGVRGKTSVENWVHLKNVGWVHQNTVKFVNTHQDRHTVTDPKWHSISYSEKQYDPFMFGGISGVDSLIQGYDGIPGFDSWYY
ncbi:SH3-like domain-containing protein [Leuconostoc gelidum subsp. gasicomitatum]|uniref:GW dipeptide domain-containing protein n=1 Tax=Leuconostoc gasicomitatum TaxID=115778 RepID=UPI001CC3ADA9|nr:GW dipeptide domain-containing protein [Leuconostoc gasicomitatum]MBZ5961367.1 SH3-like domain-containing protein [Leuconostoc gasicomitatum]MBZ5994649.1 SH3-like domain-containing protein [Leuconostoc gasicomitatum]